MWTARTLQLLRSVRPPAGPFPLPNSVQHSDNEAKWSPGHAGGLPRTLIGSRRWPDFATSAPKTQLRLALLLTHIWEHNWDATVDLFAFAYER